MAGEGLKPIKLPVITIVNEQKSLYSLPSTLYFLPSTNQYRHDLKSAPCGARSATEAVHLGMNIR